MSLLFSLNGFVDIFILKERRQQQKGIDLDSFLILPIQRLPRYELLLKVNLPFIWKGVGNSLPIDDQDMLKYMRASSSFFTSEKEMVQLAELLESVRGVNEYVNTCKRLKENTERLLHLQANIRAGKTPLVRVIINSLSLSLSLANAFSRTYLISKDVCW